MNFDSLETVGQDGGSSSSSSSGTKISAVHPDIIQTHILTRLDGPTLASAGSSSSLLHRLSTDDNLWRQICNQTWPSTADPRLRRLISTFPAAHRSLYSDSFPILDHQFPSPPNHRRRPPTSQLISAVDIRYRDRLLLSKVHETETETGWFLCSPFRIDLIEPKETVPTPVKFHGDDDTCQSDLEDNLTLSWILIDPTCKRAASISSLRPVSVRRHWLTGDVIIRYATVMAGNLRGQLVQCGVTVTCGGKEGGELKVKEACLQVEDMEGRNLNGKEGLGILREAMEGGNRRKGKTGEAKQRCEDFLKMKKESRERKQRRERSLDLVCMATGVTIFIAWAFLLMRRYS